MQGPEQIGLGTNLWRAGTFMGHPVYHWWLVHRYSSLMWCAYAVIGFTVIWRVYVWYDQKERRKIEPWVWWLYNATGIAVGVLVSGRAKEIRLGTERLTFPTLLATPVCIILTLALGKLFIGIASMSLRDGIMLDSWKPKANNQKELLLEAWSSDAIINNILVNLQSEVERDALRELRCLETNDADFAYAALYSILENLNHGFAEHGLDGKVDLLFGMVSDLSDSMYNNLPKEAYAAVSIAARDGNHYWSDKKRGQSVFSIQITYYGETFLVTNHFKDKIFNPQELQSFWVVILAMLNEPTIADRGQAGMFRQALIQHGLVN